MDRTTQGLNPLGASDFSLLHIVQICYEDGALSTAAKQPGNLMLNLKKRGAIPPLYQICHYNMHSSNFL
jgi:hypothetical protein